VKNEKNENKNESESEEISGDTYPLFFFSPVLFPFSNGSANSGVENRYKMRFPGSDDRSRGYSHF